MHRLIALAVCAILCFTSFCTGVNADILLSTSTYDSADLDFDGSGNETNGGLTAAEVIFNLSGSDIPGTSEFANITSITLSVSTFDGSGSVLSGATDLRGIAGDGGIGAFNPDEGDSEASYGLDGAVGEDLNFSISSTSTDGTVVVFSGIEFAGWTNNSAVDFTGVAQSGSSNYSGASSFVDFDNATNSFSLQATEISGPADTVFLGALELRVVPGAVPEPGTIGLVSLLGLAAIIRRQRKVC